MNNKQIGYKKHIIAYLDILGFKALMEKESFNQTFTALFHMVDSFTNYDLPAMRLKGIKTAVLSDSIVFSIEHKQRGAFNKIMSMINAVQRLLMQNNIVFRGAIAVGDLYHEGNVIIGPGLVSAYLLQEHSAIYPRCILEDSVLRQCLDTCASAIDKEVTVKKFKKDTDGFWYYDYFSADLRIMMYIDGKDGTDNSTDFILHCRNLIATNLEQCRSPKIRAKYEWLKHRYNHALKWVIDDNIPFDVDLDSMMLKDEPLE